MEMVSFISMLLMFKHDPGGPKLPLHNTETPSAEQIVLTAAWFSVTSPIAIQSTDTDSSAVYFSSVFSFSRYAFRCLLYGVTESRQSCR